MQGTHLWETAYFLVAGGRKTIAEPQVTQVQEPMECIGTGVPWKNSKNLLMCSWVNWEQDVGPWSWVEPKETVSLDV
jgi:hypothetical protein